MIWLVRAGDSSRFPVRHSLLVHRLERDFVPDSVAGVRLFRFEGGVGNNSPHRRTVPLTSSGTSSCLCACRSDDTAS